MLISQKRWFQYSVLASAVTCSLVVAPVLANDAGAIAPVVSSATVTAANSAQSWEQQAQTLYETGRFAEAVSTLEQVVQVYQQQGDGIGQAIALSNLSLSYQKLGNWEAATRSVETALQLLQRSPQAPDAIPVSAQVLDVRGSLYLARGNVEQALKTWEQAASVYDQTKDVNRATLSRINQAHALQTLGLYRRAIETLQNLETQLQQQPDPLTRSTLLRSLGEALRSIGNLEEAETVLHKSLDLATQARSPEAMAATNLSLGNVALAQARAYDVRGKGEAAQAALEKTFNFYQAAVESPVVLTRAQAYLNYLHLLTTTSSNLLPDSDPWAEASELYPYIQELIPQLPPGRAGIDVQLGLGQHLIRLRQNSPEQAPAWTEIAQIFTAAVQQAKDLNDPRSLSAALGNLGALYEQTQQWSEAQTLTQQALVLAQSIDAPDIAYRWQWQLGRLMNQQGNDSGAIAAYTEAVNTLKLLRNDLVAINTDVQFSFRDHVEPVYRQLVNLLLPTDSTPTQQQLAQARDVIESLQLAELDNFFQEACLQARSVKIDQIDTQAAVFYPIVLEDRFEVVLSIPHQPLRHYSIPIAQEQVDQTFLRLQQLLIPHASSQERLQLSQQVYDWLIRPVEADLSRSNIKSLVFVLDGVLRNFPMATLHDGDRYLVEKYGIALTPGLQLLKSRPLTTHKFQILTGGLTEARQGFSALPGVHTELQQITAEVPAKVLLNQNLTSAGLQKEIRVASSPIVHLATHGQFSSDADQTFLLTWDGQINVKELSQVFQGRDQGNPNPVELLVLSACQTAKGDNRAGLGLAGLAVRSGARSTLASLWSVNDEATSTMMPLFYHALSKPGTTKAEALRQSQLALLKDPRYSHPYYWAPFVLVGNWQ